MVTKHEGCPATAAGSGGRAQSRALDPEQLNLLPLTVACLPLDHLQEEVKRIQSVPLVIGQFLEMVDANSGIVGSTTGSNYYVRILSTLNRELLKPSSSVALHRSACSPGRGLAPLPLPHALGRGAGRGASTARWLAPPQISSWGGVVRAESDLRVIGPQPCSPTHHALLLIRDSVTYCLKFTLLADTRTRWWTSCRPRRTRPSLCWETTRSPTCPTRCVSNS